MLSAAQRRTLCDIARASITARVTVQPFAAPAGDGGLARHAAAFVTLRHLDALCGCIGCTESDQPLTDVVARYAAAAATDDPRFPPLTPDLVADVAIEISVLGPIEPVTEIDQIEVGRHGLIVEDGRHRGLLLPQVAVEWNWDRHAFLTQACLKAGLHRDAWKTGARLFRFEAEVFTEER